MYEVKSREWGINVGEGNYRVALTIQTFDFHMLTFPLSWQRSDLEYHTLSLSVYSHTWHLAAK